MKKYKDSIRVFNQIPHLLKRLKSSGCQLGIVTSKHGRNLQLIPSVFGIDGYFEYIVCADDTQRHKPHPEPLLKYMALAAARGKKHYTSETVPMILNALKKPEHILL